MIAKFQLAYRTGRPVLVCSKELGCDADRDIRRHCPDLLGESASSPDHRCSLKKSRGCQRSLIMKRCEHGSEHKGGRTDVKSPIPQTLHGIEITCLRQPPNETSPGIIAGPDALFLRCFVSPPIALCRSTVLMFVGT